MAIGISFTTTGNIASGTAHLLALPATVNADDLLIAVGTFFFSGAMTLTVDDSTGDDWTQLSPIIRLTPAGETHTAVYWKRADGDEDDPATVDFVTSQSVVGCGHVARLTGAHTTQDPELDYFLSMGSVTVVEGGTTVATWGAEAGNSFIAIGCAGEDDVVFSTNPTNYTGVVAAVTGGGGNAGGSNAMAYRLAFNSASDRFSSFTLASGDFCKGATVAIRAA